MPSPEDKPNTLAQEIEAERLRVWREKRAAVAEASRQERLKVAEADRRKRLEAFEADKTRRIEEAAQRRAQENAALKAERMATARSKIAGRTDIEAARKRLMAFRIRAAKMLALRLALFVLTPSLLMAVYLFTIATPLYTSHVQFALTPTSAEQPQTIQSAFETSQLSRQAHVLKEVILSPQMLTRLDEDAGFSAHFNSGILDGVSQFRITSPLASEDAALKRYINVSLNGQDGLIRIEAKAASPKIAQSFATTALNGATLWIEDSPQGPQNTVRLLTPPTLPSTTDFATRVNTLILCFLTCLALYAILSIFGRTLLRHGSH